MFFLQNTKHTLQDGTKQWYMMELLHREDGPAVIDKDGNKFWWLYGQRYVSIDSYMDRNSKIKDKVMFKIIWV